MIGLVREGDERCQEDEISRKGKGKGNCVKGWKKGTQQIEKLVMDEVQDWLKSFRTERCVACAHDEFTFCDFAPRQNVAVCLAGGDRQWAFKVIGSGFSVDLDRSRGNGRWHHQVASNRQASSRSQFEGVGDSPLHEATRAPEPNTALEHCRSKVSSLEAALTAMGQPSRPRSRCPPQCSLKSETGDPKTAIESPGGPDRRDRGESRHRIKKLEEERDAKVELLNATLHKQLRLREQVSAESATTVVNPVTTNPSEEIAQLKAEVAQLEAVANHASRRSVEAAEAVKMRAAKQRAGCVDDSLPNDEQTLCEWVDSKMMELRDATDLGDLESVFALTNLIGQLCIQDEIGNAATVNFFNMV